MISLVFIGVIFGFLMLALKGARIYSDTHGDEGIPTGPPGAAD